jgi:nucleoside-diphosphate-sugar epimerase
MSSSRNNYIDVCGEDLAYPDAQNLLDTYARAKQAAEKLVLEANGKSPNTNEKEEEDEQKGKEDYEMVHKEDVGEDSGKGNMATLAIRPGIMFGIGDPEWGERLLQGRRVCCSNGSGSTVDFAWSADVAHACMLAFQALEREYTATGKGKSAAVAVAGKAYHIGFGSGARSHVTIGDMLSANWGKSTRGYNGTLMTVLSLCNYVSWTIFARFPFDRHLFPSRLQYLHNMRWSFNNDRAEKDLKYKPIMSFKDTVKYIRNERAKALDNKRRKQHQPKDKVAKKND